MKAASRYYLDSNTAMAIVERGHTRTAAQTAFLEEVDAGCLFAASSETALSGCLVKPFRLADRAVIASLLDFLNGRRTLPLTPPSRAVMIKAAKVRAVSDMQLPDAVHVACAVEARCTVFLSADKRMRMPASMQRMAFDGIELYRKAFE